MKTKVFDSGQISEAAKLIKSGEVVAFPTETVYGLGANALDPCAVRKIFLAKGRPVDNPLIVHISKPGQAGEIAFVTPLAKKLMRRFWPGPLTVILKKKAGIPTEVTAGLDTVAVRMPKNKTALKLIEQSGVPIAAPSANLSGEPSGTAFEHVLGDFNGRIAGIIKSKICKIGIESTVVDLTSDPPALLRPGGTSLEELRLLLPDLELAFNNRAVKAKSPGMKYRHYSPKAKIVLFEGSAADKIAKYKKRYERAGKKVRVVRPEKIKNFPRRLFLIFRECDKDCVDYILIPSVSESGIGMAVMNRLRKAALKVVM